MEPSLIERTLPLGNDDGGDRVADQVGGRQAFRHQAVNSQDERYAGHWNGARGGKRRRSSVTNAAPATPAAPLEVSSSTANKLSCCPRWSGVFVACARNTAAVARYKQVPSRLKE